MSEKPSVVRWEDPPPARNNYPRGVGHSRWAGVADELRARPGVWALLGEHAAGLSTHIRLGQMLCFAPSGDFDAVSRVVDGRVLVYARYLGDPPEDWTVADV